MVFEVPNLLRSCFPAHVGGRWNSNFPCEKSVDCDFVTMSQLLFPTPDDAPLSAPLPQEGAEEAEFTGKEPISRDDKIMRYIISAAIGILIGVLEAVIISNSLVEIANSKTFSIVRGRRAWEGNEDGTLFESQIFGFRS